MKMNDRLNETNMCHSPMHLVEKNLLPDYVQLSNKKCIVVLGLSIYHDRKCYLELESLSNGMFGLGLELTLYEFCV